MRVAALASVSSAIVLLTGCGSTRHAAGTTSAASGHTATAKALAAKIGTRLTAAGYQVHTVPLDAGSGTSPGPKPIRTISVRADFSSKHSFTFFAAVFATPAAATETVKEARDECNASAACRAYSKQAKRAYQQTEVGATVFSATSDDGTSAVPPARFTHLVAVATGGR